MVKISPSSAAGAGSIPGQTKIPHASRPTNQNIKQKQYCNKFNKDLKMVHIKKKKNLGFPGGSVVENLPANAGDTGSSPDLGRSHMLAERLGL